MAYTTIDDPTIYFNTKLYTGNGSTQSITGVGFQPDWVWIKNRGAVTNHEVADSVRGANKLLKPNDTDAEQSNSNKITSFDSDGFGVGNDANVNQNSTAIVSWNWKAGGAGSSNSNGSIASTVSANTTAGFSIVSWTGSGSSATIGHGLGATPKYIIVKNRTDSVNWFLYNHSIITAGASNKSFMTLNETDALGTNGSATTFTSVSSTTFGVGTDNIINGSSDNMIAYVFAEKKGYSKFGSYTGNGNADGTFVYTGFKPAWVMFKRTSGTTNWQILDNKRSTFNPVNKHLRANTSIAEFTNYPVDFLSNGFKFRNTDGDNNTSGETYIYMAFAESPFVNSNGVPNNAR